MILYFSWTYENGTSRLSILFGKDRNISKAFQMKKKKNNFQWYIQKLSILYMLHMITTTKAQYEYLIENSLNCHSTSRSNFQAYIRNSLSHREHNTTIKLFTIILQFQRPKSLVQPSLQIQTNETDPHRKSPVKRVVWGGCPAAGFPAPSIVCGATSSRHCGLYPLCDGHYTVGCISWYQLPSPCFRAEEVHVRD